MRPLLYSELDATTKKIGWIRTGENIKYYKNAIRSGSCSSSHFSSFSVSLIAGEVGSQHGFPKHSPGSAHWYPPAGIQLTKH